MSFIREFKAFVSRGNVIDLAVAVVLGAAFAKIVSSVVDGVIMPIVGAVLPGGDWRTFTVTSLNIKVGAVLAAIVDFTIVAFVIFVVVNKVMASIKKKEAPAPTTKKCRECQEDIPIEAKRCRACAQPV